MAAAAAADMLPLHGHGVTRVPSPPTSGAGAYNEAIVLHVLPLGVEEALTVAAEGPAEGRGGGGHDPAQAMAATSGKGQHPGAAGGHGVSRGK